MDSFSKIRESSGKEEQKRQMINKAIDLLHKFVNKRVDYDNTRADISRIVSEYYMIDENEGVEKGTKIHLEVMINNAFDVISGIKDEKLNLYQAIMLINKIMAHKDNVNRAKEQNEVKEPKLEEKKVVERKTPNNMVSMEEKKEDWESDVFSIKMKRVIDNKKKLLLSIKELNKELKAHGFSLNSLGSK